MFRLIRDWWRARQRATDMQILWPVCKQQAQTLEHAKMAFAAHAYNDPAWIDHYGHDDLRAFIDALE